MQVVRNILEEKLKKNLLKHKKEYKIEKKSD